MPAQGGHHVSGSAHYHAGQGYDDYWGFGKRQYVGVDAGNRGENDIEAAGCQRRCRLSQPFIAQGIEMLDLGLRAESFSEGRRHSGAFLG